MGYSISLDHTSSLPSRHEKWMRIRQRKDGEFTLKATDEVSEKIDVLVEQSKDGLFDPQDHHDIFVEAIEIEDHYGLVRGFGRGVGF
ncbi:unnamed protein product [Lathyrus oleraceus]